MRKILVCICMLFLLSACNNIETRKIKSCILSQEETTYSSGTFVIFAGRYDSGTEIETKYYLYIEGEEGGFKLQTIDAEYLELVETNDKKPCIKGEFTAFGNIKDGQNYTAYVPEGTIFEDYKANIVEELK